MKQEWHYGVRNNYAVLYPVDDPVGVVQIVHGICEYIGRYEPFIHFLNDQGFIVCGEDHVGHGQTVADNDELGVFPKQWADLVEDVADLQKQVANKYPKLPYIMLGHSMGSFLVRTYAEKYGNRLDGLIIMGTGQMPIALTTLGIGIANLVGLIKGDRYRSILLKQLSTGTYNKKFKPLKTPVEWLSCDLEVQKAYMKDPKCAFLPTVSMQKLLFKGAHHISRTYNIRKMPKNLPILLLSGSQDPVGGFGIGVLRYYERLIRVGMDDASLKLYPHCRHEILNEYSKQAVFQDIRDWILNKIKR